MHALLRDDWPLEPNPVQSEDLPAESPLAMPVQSLWRDAADGIASPPTRWWPIVSLLLATLVLTAAASTALFRVLNADTLGPLDIALLLDFALLFAWTTFSFVSALSGMFARVGADKALGIDPQAPLPALTRRIAILLPVYNEAPQPLFARLYAILRSLAAAGAADDFDVFVLSDTTDGDIRELEYRGFQALRMRIKSRGRVFYRHRPRNIDRKAGNLAEWVRRFGGAYESMVVLDADSLMEGDTLVRLAAAMERNSGVGLIQTNPMVVNRHSLFARTEQFASRLYGPMLARGIAWWSGGQGNYWGHNAIIRVRAFAAQAGLPHLPGRKPFGGHILSHDFVEAALLRRAGWSVHMAPGLGGSYEESPPTLNDLIARDNRWCQGNLQHVLVLPGRGFHWISRLHLLRGVSSYITAPLWLSLIGMGVLLALRPDWGVSAAAITDPRAEVFVPQDMQTVGGILVVSLAFLLAPKVMAYFDMLASPRERRLFGGAKRAAISVLAEILISAMFAPARMLSQTCALVRILCGRDAGWAAQRRSEEGLSFEEAANHHLAAAIIGIGLGFVANSVSAQTFLLVSPVFLGLVGCIPMAALTARRDLGLAARRAGLLVIPEETAPPLIFAHANLDADFAEARQRSVPAVTEDAFANATPQRARR